MSVITVERLSPRVLFLGQNWYGSCARACCYALRRLGCDVADVDAQTIVPQLRRRSSRALLRVLHPRLLQEYNRLVLDTAETVQPELVVAFKGALVEAATLCALRGGGAVLCNYYPDTSVFAHGGLLPDAIGEYDRVFFTKSFGEDDVRIRLRLRGAEYLPHGYDPEVHRPLLLQPMEVRRFACDVGVIATHTAPKERMLDDLLERIPDLDLRIWGNGWRERCTSPRLRERVEGVPLNGTTYAKAVRAIRINLALLSGPVRGASQGDETTTRTFEIPACGGFMLHPRSAELLEMFTEREEVACYDSADELAAQVEHYLAHPEDRDRIAAAGHARCVPAYSYDGRMARILAWFAGRGVEVLDADADCSRVRRGAVA